MKKKYLVYEDIGYLKKAIFWFIKFLRYNTKSTIVNRKIKKTPICDHKIPMICQMYHSIVEIGK